MPTDFNVGEKFSSLDELYQKLEQYKVDNSTELSIDDSRLIKSACKGQRLAEGDEREKALKYSELKYVCVASGTCKPRGRGLRKSRTLKKGCPFYIRFRLDKDRQALEVKDIQRSHNHELNANLFRHYPRQRKLQTIVEADAIQLLKAKADKKMVRSKIAIESGKVVTMRDVHNLAQKAKTDSEGRNNLQDVVDLLRNEFGCSVNVHQDKENNFLGMMFQDTAMKTSFKS
ncbi:uncharacterized protein, partial [Clytia hemisphaerica]